MSKAPKAFTAEQVFTIYGYAMGITGPDFPRAFRIAKEIRALPEFFHDKKAQQIGIKLPKPDAEGKVNDELFLHLKPSDLSKIWGWIKEKNLSRKDPKTGEVTSCSPAVLISLEDIATALGQVKDYESVVADMATEPDEKDEDDGGSAA